MRPTEINGKEVKKGLSDNESKANNNVFILYTKEWASEQYKNHRYCTIKKRKTPCNITSQRREKRIL